MEKFLALIKRRSNRKTDSEYKDEVLLRQGREQFKRLLEKGIGIPVTLL